ncbi:hypothetical protein PZ61_0237570 [Streptomyces sp. MNU77]|nr:hypothetical protein PZ61_0237570 [Streptomyces sp. MNU77]
MVLSDGASMLIGQSTDQLLVLLMHLVSCLSFAHRAPPSSDPSPRFSGSERNEYRDGWTGPLDPDEGWRELHLRPV